MAQVTPSPDKMPNKRQREFVRLWVWENVPIGKAYKQAGFASNVNDIQKAEQLLAKTYVQRYADRMRQEYAEFLKKKQAALETLAIINQQTQTQKLEALRLKAESSNDLTTALGCIREENKVYGLVKDSLPTDEKQAEIDAAIREQAAKLSVNQFLMLDTHKQD